MPNLNALASTQAIQFGDRSGFDSPADATVRVLKTAAENGSIQFLQGGTFKDYQQASGEPTVAHFPNDKDWGPYRNTATGRLRLAFNNNGTIVTVQSSGALEFDPLQYYQAADGSAWNLAWDRCMRAMETPPNGKLLVCRFPAGSYSFAGTVQLPQTSDATLAKVRMEINGAGCHIYGDFNGPLFARTSGTPTPDSLYITLRNLSLEFTNKSSPEGTWQLDPDTYNLPFNPAKVRNGIELESADGFLIDNCNFVNCDTGILFRGTKNAKTFGNKFAGCNVQVRCETDGSDRNCERIVCAENNGQGGDGAFRIDYLFEETDGCIIRDCVTESGASTITYVWICNDRTDCYSHTIKNGHFEYYDPSGPGYYIQNKTEGAKVLIENMMGAGHGIVVRSDGTGQLNVHLKDPIWYNTNTDFGADRSWNSLRTTITNIEEFTTGTNNAAVYNGKILVTFSAPHYYRDAGGWRSQGDTVVISGTANYDGTHILAGTFGADPQAGLPDNQAVIDVDFVVPESGSFSCRALHDVETWIKHDMPLNTPAANTPLMQYIAKEAVTDTEEEPAPAWHPNLSGGSSDYYPVGQEVYYKGEIFENRVAAPSTEPTPTTTTADWEYKRPAKWIPVYDPCVCGTIATHDAECTSGNPKATPAANIHYNLEGIKNVDPIVDNSAYIFSNGRVPPYYLAQGQFNTAFALTYWMVADGTQVVGA